MIAILSDIHGNLPALQAVVRHAIDRRCRKFISLGDVVSYYAQPGECIELLKELNTINILGNHDAYLINDTNCPRSKVVSKIIEHHKKIITSSQLAWLRKSVFSYREGSTLFVHGGPEDYQDQYLYNVSKNIFPEGINRLFSGHTHVQILVNFEEKIYCNPGSVGQPRDGDRRAAYATIEDSNIILHRVDYDIGRTISVMKSAGYEAFYYENLYQGSQIGGRIDRIKVIREGI